jgi:hypothetical protein
MPHNSGASARQVLFRGVFPHLAIQFVTFSVLKRGPATALTFGAPAQVGVLQLPVGLTQVGTSVAFVADAFLMWQVADSAPPEGVTPKPQVRKAVQVLPFFVVPHSNLHTSSMITAPFDLNAGSGADQHDVDMQLLVPFVHFPSGPHVELIWPAPPLQAFAVQTSPVDVVRQACDHAIVSSNMPTGRSGHTLLGGSALHGTAGGNNSSSGGSKRAR